MRFVCITSPYYDYLTATLIEGLQELGHDIFASENSNYATNTSNSRIRKEAEKADSIIVFSNNQVRTWLVEDIANPNKVYVDGSDRQEFRVYPYIRFKLVFKRELSRCWENKAVEPVYPLPFAAEKRYFKPIYLPRDIRVSFAANLNNNTMRYSVHQRLLNRREPTIFSGSTGEHAYSSKKARGLPIETPKYRDILYRSRIAVNVAGAGYDCARFWEIPAAGALLFTQELDIFIPNPFTDGTNCVIFRSLDEFSEKLDFLMSSSSNVSMMAESGREHLLKYHTTIKRAEYFLKVVSENRDGNGFCDSFFVGDRPASLLNRLYLYIKR